MAPRVLKAVTLNVWNRSGMWPERLRLITRELAELAPDVVGLQEVMRLYEPGREPSAPQDQTAEIASELGYAIAYAPAADYGNGLVMGNAILMGDFNAAPDADEIRFLTGLSVQNGRSAYFADAWVYGGDGGPGTTYDHGMTTRARIASQRGESITFSCAAPTRSSVANRYGRKSSSMSPRKALRALFGPPTTSASTARLRSSRAACRGGPTS